jgi:hypothetical protein
MLHAIEMD